MTERITLVSGDARVELAPTLGGTITAFDWRERAVLRRTTAEALRAADVRSASCYPLVPYSNRIGDAHLCFADVDHALAHNFGDHPHAIHGVGWQCPWSVANASATTACLTLDHDARGDAARAWPWPFRTAQAFVLSDSGASGATLTASISIENTGERPFPFGLGWHPFFAKAPDSALKFEAAGVWLNDPTQLPVRLIGVPPDWNFATTRPTDDVVLDNVFTGWSGRATLASSRAGTLVALQADRACSFLVVYAPSTSNFVALEPVTHQTDAFNRAARGATGTGTRILRPGAAFSCTMRINVRTPFPGDSIAPS